MTRSVPEAESWRRMVLHSMPPVSWLTGHAPHSDVVLSSRCRHMRNLTGRRFPHKMKPEHLMDVSHEIIEAIRRSDIALEQLRGMTLAERDYLVGCRLVSPDFLWQEPGRVLLVDKVRSIALMINEEDHLRLQGVTAGWSIDSARFATESILEILAQRLEFAHSEPFGFLSASPYNCGMGRRLSAMFHLIGLAHVKRLTPVLLALAERGLTTRGLFGESSRAVGAYVQVSATSGSSSGFIGACEYLLQQEREARESVSEMEIEQKVDQARSFAISQRTLSLADSLRILAWMRWGSSRGIANPTKTVRDIDAILTRLELKSEAEEESADERRSAYLRKALGF